MRCLRTMQAKVNVQFCQNFIMFASINIILVYLNYYFGQHACPFKAHLPKEYLICSTENDLAQYDKKSVHSNEDSKY